jgi:peptide chain release factor subunit 1
MLSDTDIQTLEQDHRLQPPVLSLYLNTDRRHPEGSRFLAPLWHLLKTADLTLRRRLTPEGAEARERLHMIVTPRLVEFLEKEVASVTAIRSVAAFASLVTPKRPGPQQLTTYTLPRPVRSQVHIDPRPYVRPLLFLLDQYERYAVIVADRKHARFFTVVLGEIEKIASFVSDTPQRHGQGGWSQKRFQRHVDDHIAKHVQRVTGYARRALRRLSAHRLILGGDGETLRLIREQLPPEFRERIVGTFPLDVHAPVHAIRERTLAGALAAEEREEAQKIAELREALAHRGHAVRGLLATLDALTQRRALTLIVKKGFHAPGALCENCDALLATSGLCPHCRTQTEDVEDIVEHAVEYAHRDNVTIEFVAENLDLEALGNIGALLRF